MYSKQHQSQKYQNPSTYYYQQYSYAFPKSISSNHSSYLYNNPNFDSYDDYDYSQDKQYSYVPSKKHHHSNTPTHRSLKKHAQPKHPLSSDDLKRQKIAEKNHKFVKKHPEYIDYNVETIDESYHSIIKHSLSKPLRKGTFVSVTRYSSIDTAIYYHNKGYSNICILNFADAKKMGGGYLNGRNAQEESLCRQTLLYPTLQRSYMYQLYKNDHNLNKNDFMTYSPNVLVIRDNNNKRIKYPFYVNIISAPAVDNRKYVKHANKIMERRIRKIIKLAAYKGNSVLILGAFGCGVFNNDPREISNIFGKILIGENLKDYFQQISFPIYKNDGFIKIFQKVFHQK